MRRFVMVLAALALSACGPALLGQQELAQRLAPFTRPTPSGVELSAIFGREVNAVCVVGDYFSEPLLRQQSARSLDVSGYLTAIRRDYTDTSQINIYLFDDDARLLEKYTLIPGSGDVLVADTPGGKMACHAAVTRVTLQRDAENRIAITFPDHVIRPPPVDTLDP